MWFVEGEEIDIGEGYDGDVDVHGDEEEAPAWRGAQTSDVKQARRKVRACKTSINLSRGLNIRS